MSLEDYARKRDFRRTAEPAARAAAKNKKATRAALRFVIQKHTASHLHYDFRLEMDGALKSWAVPKGLPYAKDERHLAVHVEDHPLAYIDFEGTIPKGEYGGGTVMVWDHGTYKTLGEAPAADLAGGKLHVVLSGQKLRGEWYLVRLRDEDQWLIIKGGEAMKPIGKTADDTSALSGHRMKELARSDRVWQPNAATPAKPAKRRPKSAAAPLPEFVAPMQAKLAAAAPRSGDWTYEIKFDGWRALALKGGSEARLLSRNEKDLGAKFPEIREAVAALDARDAILDGEIVALDARGRSSFQLLQAYDLGETRPPIFFYVFDLLHWNGKSLVGRPLKERRASLETLLQAANPGVIRHSASLGADAGPLLEQARTLGLEGLIGKRAGSCYEVGARSGAWIKLKLHREQEVVIGGYTEPTGARRHFGSLVIGVHAEGRLQCVGRVGTGFDAKLLRAVHARLQPLARDGCPFANLPAPRGGRWGQGLTAAEMKRCHWVAPELVCQVKFSEWTQDHRLRQPVFLGLREDKPAADVVREDATGVPENAP